MNRLCLKLVLVALVGVGAGKMYVHEIYPETNLAYQSIIFSSHEITGFGSSLPDSGVSVNQIQSEYFRITQNITYLAYNFDYLNDMNKKAFIALTKTYAIDFRPLIQCTEANKDFIKTSDQDLSDLLADYDQQKGFESKVYFKHECG